MRTVAKRGSRVMLSVHCQEGFIDLPILNEESELSA